MFKLAHAKDCALTVKLETVTTPVEAAEILVFKSVTLLFNSEIVLTGCVLFKIEAIIAEVVSAFVTSLDSAIYALEMSLVADEPAKSGYFVIPLARCLRLVTHLAKNR